MDVVNIINRIRLFSNAKVDCNYGQGREAVMKHLTNLLKVDAISVDRLITRSKENMAKLTTQVTPYQLPDDYLFFLEFYGGLCLEPKINDPLLDVFGLGPMRDTWYSDIIECNLGSIGPGVRPLYISRWEGSLPWTEEAQKIVELASASGKMLTPFDDDYPPRSQQVKFYLDLAGSIQKHSIISESEHVPEGKQIWKKVSDSFTEWLELVATTRGLLGYSEEEN